MRLICLFAVVLCGCSPTTAPGPVEVEDGVVKSLIYVPAGHGVNTSLGVSSAGKPVVMNGITNIPARYGVVFECQHGSFAVDVKKEQFEKLKEGQQVSIRYRTVYSIGKNGIRLAPVDLDFVDAVPAR